MTISTQTSQVQYTANGIQTVFDFDFKIMQSGDMKVYFNNVLQSSGYTVDGVEVSDGGTVTFTEAPASGTVVRLKRVTAKVQELILREFQKFPAESLEKNFDKIVSMIQELVLADTELAEFVEDLVGLPSAQYVGELAPTYQFQGMRWYNPTIPATFVYYIDDDSGQWVEEAHEGIDGGLRADLGAVGSTVPVAGIPALYVASLVNSVVNVKAFGAKGDGVTDDSLAIQAAIDFIESNPSYNLDSLREGYGGTVFFPQGRYVATGLTISKFNIEFKGVAGASFLVNKQTTGTMLVAQWDGGSNTLGGVQFTTIEVRNTVDRADNAGPLIILDKPVRSQFHRFVMTSSDFNSGSKASKRGDGIKLIAPFEVTGSVIIYGFLGIGMDVISGPQSDSFELEGVFAYNSVGLVGFRGAGGSGNNNFKFTGKFLGNQGGTYISGGNDAYAETTVVSTSGNDLTVASATNMKVNRAVVVGRTNTLEVAIIKAIVGNVLTLDRPITLGAGETVISGRIGCVTSEMRNPSFKGIQFEGCDVALYTTQGTTKVVLDEYVLSSCSKAVLVNGKIRKIVLNNGVAASSGTPANGVTWKLLTLLNIEDRYNSIFIEDNPAEGSGYTDGTRDSLIDNRSGFLPFIEMKNRIDGTFYNAKNSNSAVTFEDNTYLSFSRTATNKFSRMSWKEGTTDKWFNDFTRTAGDLEWRLNGETVASLTFSGTNGIPTLGDGVWNNIPTKIGTQYLWQDANGKLRTKVGAPSADIQGDVVAGYESAWDSDSRLKLGLYHLWVDAAGKLRIKGNVPTSDTDGTIVGTQA